MNSLTFSLHTPPSSLQTCDSGGEREADRSSRTAFERAMHRAGIAHEIRASPTMSSEEFVWLEVALEPIAWGTSDDQVAGIVRTTSCQRHDVIERRRTLVEMDRTVDAALAAVTQGHLAHRSLHRDVHDAARTTE